MMKIAQQNQQGQLNLSDELLSKLMGPATSAVGMAGAFFGGKHLLKGSPELRMAAMVGLPAALYNYFHYRNPTNMLKAQSSRTKKLMDDLQKDPNSMFNDPDAVRYVNELQKQRTFDDYSSPMRTGLRKALPMFALGAALPSALRIMIR